MIRETIVTTASATGEAHVAPMGATIVEGGYLLQPFRPSRTLDNLAALKVAVVNFSDDARIFAGCISGRHRSWPTVPATRLDGAVRLDHCLAHDEVEIVRMEDDPTRPRFFCRTVHRETHAPFLGLNRAVAAVLEGAILVSRLHMMDPDRVDREMNYLSVAIEKTAGPAEREAWDWLCETIADHRARAAS
ncbi:DUF447 family protein [Xanthobacter dioxanivorans]|uniref:DUF447 family protein n=1 Tax=Xanthobacter dioxanivorans TaxID=2528964 RepID=A0A974SIZ6_9HYPH|nr:DUF447 domain-containing protein [Xanthobacter dioxanivorans]QRG05858.1 DUF447 family protein [Xanthobacter dioxanivorans]